MLNNKKAQGLPIQTIVIFAILLIVMIVLLVFFTGKFSFFGKTIGTCTQQGGTCLYKQESLTDRDALSCSQNQTFLVTQDCAPQKGKMGQGGPCCIKLG